MILFLAENYNDLDRHVALIHRLVKDGRKDIEMVVQLPTTLFDFRIAYIKGLGVPVSYYHGQPGDGAVRFRLARFAYGSHQRLEEKTAKLLGKIGGRNGILERRFLESVRSLKDWVKHTLYGMRHLHAFFDSRDIRVIVKDDRYRDRDIIDEAVRRKIPIFVFRHGLNAAAGEGQVNVKAEGVRLSSHWFRAFGIQFELERQRLIAMGMEPEKILVLGSPRFCPEWVEQYKKIVPAPVFSAPRSEPRKLRVVFMDHHSNYRMDPEAIKDTILAIRDLDFVELIIKGSTGDMSNKAKRKRPTHLTRGLLKHCRVETEEHSHHLIAWADVVINTVSSIFLEVLLQDKPLIFPTHFTQNDMLFNTEGACLSVNNKQEMIEALRRFHEEPGWKPYPRQAVDRVLEEIVFGAEPGRDVLGDYAARIYTLESPTLSPPKGEA